MKHSLPTTGHVPARVCYLSSIIANEHSGTEAHLIRLLRALNRESFDPCLISLQNAPFVDAWSDDRVAMRSLGYRSFFRPTDWMRIVHLSRWLRRERYQIVEFHSPEAQFVGTLAATWARVPVLIGCRRSLGYNYDRKARLQISLTNRWIDCFLANSRGVVQQRSAAEGIRAERFRCIYNGVNVTQFDKDQVGACPELSALPAHTVSIVMAANLRPVKNHALLLRAAKLVIAQEPNARFLLLGSGDEQPSLMALADQLEIADSVIFLGAKVPVAPYLHRADIGCLTSDSEGFSNAILEYMAARLPVVATRVGGAIEQIVDGETGYLVPPQQEQQLAERLISLVRNQPLRESMGRAGRSRIEAQFNQDAQIAAYEQLYRDLLQQARKT